jgi:D-proline reductase (dithiol) PrdB
MRDDSIRACERDQPVAAYDGTPFTAPPALTEARVAIVTTAGLRLPDDERFGFLDESFRIFGSTDGLFMDHFSSNFDRSGWLADPNVVVPVERLHELAADGVIGSVAPRHLSFHGAQMETLTTIELDSGPAAAALLREDGVDVVLLTPV